MNPIKQTILPGLTLLCVLAGCSKSPDTAPKSGAPAAPAVVEQAAAPAPAAIADDKPVELKAVWAVGKKYTLRKEMTQDSAVIIPGLPKPVQSQAKASEDCLVAVLQARPDGGRDLEVTFLAEKFDANMGTTSLASFDSGQDATKDTGNPAAPVLRKLVGAKIRCAMNAAGKVDKVEGFAEFKSRLGSGGGSQVASMLQGLVSEGHIKQICDLAQGLPDHPVKPGDVWTSKQEIESPEIGKLVISMDCAFKSWEDHDGRRCARIEYQGTIASAAPGTASEARAKIQSGTVSGKAWFDPGQAMVLEDAGEQTMMMKISAQGMELDSRVTQITSGKVLKVE